MGWRDAPVVADGGWQSAPLVEEKKPELGAIAAQAFADTPGWQKPLVNLGAGMDSLWQGAKGMFGQTTDAEVRQKRVRDEAAAQGMTGGGALQVAGEILPTLALPGGAMVGAASKLPMLAGRAALQVTPKLGTVAAIADSALAGGAMGALQPVTSDESRTKNVALGGLLGGAIPGALAVGKQAVGLFSKGGATDRAAQSIIGKLGGSDAAQQAMREASAYKPGAFVADVPMTTAEVTQNPVLARMQAGAQAKAPDQWMALRQAQAQQRYQALRDATGDAEKIGAYGDARATATDSMRDKALGAAGKDAWFSAPVAQDVSAMLAGGSGSSPAVKQIGTYVRGELEGGITPERLYTVRKVLADKLSGPMQIGDELGAAARGAQRETMGVINSIDSALDKASGGKWTPYLEKYQQASKPVTNARASSDIRDIFEREGAPMTGDVLSGQVPAITGLRLGRAMDKFGANKFGDALNYGTRDALGQLQGNIARTEGLQNLLKNTATSGGGSMTTPLKEAVGDMAMGALNAKTHGIAGLVANGIGVQGRTQKAIQNILQDPQAFIAAIERQTASGKPLTATQQFYLRLAQTAGTGTGALLTQ